MNEFYMECSTPKDGGIISIKIVEPIYLKSDLRKDGSVKRKYGTFERKHIGYVNIEDDNDIFKIDDERLQMQYSNSRTYCL